MTDKNDINNLLRQYTVQTLIRFKLDQIEADKKELERQAQEAKEFLGSSTGKIKAKGEDGRKTRWRNARTSKILELIRSAGIKGITNDEITKRLDWGDDHSISIAHKKQKVRYATKQMVRLEQVKVHNDGPEEPNRFYI